MSTPKDMQILKAIAAIKAAIDIGNSTQAMADVAKLIAMVSAGMAAESVARAYTGLSGLGKILSDYRLGKTVTGNEADIARSAFIAGQVAAQLVGAGIDEARDWGLGGKVYDLLHPEQIDGAVNTNFSNARNWTAPRDPLILDLDGDGIEAVGINPSAPILFDMDGDGVKTATGWIKADDGIVVMDRNGNGLIDSGRELFGDSTVLTRGPRAGQTAANGYEALADLDINGDGAIDSADAAYADLRVWQDANQDGVSQANELRTLSDAGIASMNVAGQVSNINLGNGNTQPFSGSFTRMNGGIGSTGASGVINRNRSHKNPRISRLLKYLPTPENLRI